MLFVSFDKTDRSDIGLSLVGFVLSVDYGSETTLALLSSDGKRFSQCIS